MTKDKCKNILEMITNKKNYIQEDEHKINKLINKIKKLEEDKKIQEYLNILKDLRKAESIIEKKEMKYKKIMKEECPHPLFNMIPGIDFRGNIDFNNGQVKCVQCGKIMNYDKDKIKELYEQKKLITRFSREYDWFEGRGWNEYKPSLIKTSEIRQYYYELYLKYEYLKKQGYEDMLTEYSIEELVWQNYCAPQKTNDKKRMKI